MKPHDAETLEVLVNPGFERGDRGRRDRRSIFQLSDDGDHMQTYRQIGCGNKALPAGSSVLQSSGGTSAFKPRSGEPVIAS